MFIRRADQALVPFDFANAAIKGPGPYGILTVGGQQMAGFIYSIPGVRLLSLPGQDVRYVRGAVQFYQLNSCHPSYINAVLIQSRERPENPACTACCTAPGLCPFPQCVRAPGHFGGACGNCKWRDHAARCSVRDRDQDGDDDEQGDDGRGDPPAQPPAPQEGSARTVPENCRLLPGSTPDNAIVLA